jgi:PknH-like protein
MMRSSALASVAVSACLLVTACAAPSDGRPVVHIAPAAQPSVSRPVAAALPTNDELIAAFGGAGFVGQLVNGGPDMLLQGVDDADATPVDCVSAGYRLEKAVYGASPVQSVASQTWTGGSFDSPPTSGFFGVVKFATSDDAKAFFAASADKWHRCNGQTLVLNQVAHGAQGTSKITDVRVDTRLVSALVLRDGGAAVERALGLAGDCVVDVEVTAADPASDAHGAVTVADLMLKKIGAA